MGAESGPADPVELVAAWADVQGEALYRVIVSTHQGKPKMGRCMA